MREKHRIESFDALDFDDNLIADDQVRPVFREQFAFVKSWDSNLSGERDYPSLRL